MAYRFNGSSQRLSVAAAPVAALPLTLFCIYVPSTTGAGNTLIAIENTTTYESFRIGVAPSGQLRVLCVNPDGGASAVALSNTIATAGQAYYVAGVFTSSTSRAVFVNSVKTTNTSDLSITATNLTTTTIGAVTDNLGGFTQYTNGAIAELAFWNAALSDAEIRSLSTGFTPDQIRPQSLNFYAPLMRNLIDVRGGRTITNVNSAIVTTHPRIIT